MGEVFGWITSEQFWLPQGVSWNQLHSETGVHTYPKPGDLLVIIPISLIIVVMQAALEKCVCICVLELVSSCVIVLLV